MHYNPKCPTNNAHNNKCVESSPLSRPINATAAIDSLCDLLYSTLLSTVQIHKTATRNTSEIIDQHSAAQHSTTEQSAKIAATGNYRSQNTFVATLKFNGIHGEISLVPVRIFFFSFSPSLIAPMLFMPFAYLINKMIMNDAVAVCCCCYSVSDGVNVRTHEH